MNEEMRTRLAAIETLLMPKEGLLDGPLARHLLSVLGHTIAYNSMENPPEAYGPQAPKCLGCGAISDEFMWHSVHEFWEDDRCGGFVVFYHCSECNPNEIVKQLHPSGQENVLGETYKTVTGAAD